MGKVVMLHLDALSLEYLLRGWLRQSRALFDEAGYTELRTGLSYEGITASMMTGVNPAGHEVWTHFAFTDQPPPVSISSMSRIPDYLSRSDQCESYGTMHGLVPRAIASAMRRLVGVNVPWWRYHYIPIRWLPKFAFALPKFDAITSYDDINSNVTLAGIARQRGLHCAELFGSWSRVIEELPALVEGSDFIFVHTLMELDQVGHQSGPTSDAVQSLLKSIDQSLANLLKTLVDLVGSNGMIIAFSDHGMCPVSARIDVLPLLRNALEESPETVAFVDSTMIRIWTTANRVGDWRRRLATVNGLRFLDNSERSHLPHSRSVIGDLVAVAEPGTLLSPNFWQGDELLSGMHGYASHDKWQSAFLSVLPAPRRKFRAAVLAPEDVFAIAKDGLFQ